MPAMPMKEAALRYSPEMADAFQPTLTLRPATKKSCAVFERRAAQKPMKIVTTTVTALKARTYGSMCILFPHSPTHRLTHFPTHLAHFRLFEGNGAFDE